jgi:hypothetical protein
MAAGACWRLSAVADGNATAGEIIPRTTAAALRYLPASIRCMHSGKSTFVRSRPLVPFRVMTRLEAQDGGDKSRVNGCIRTA